MTFPSTNPALDRALVARAYETPTPVQLAVLEETALGRDLLVSAQTGSGKTVAFGLAMAKSLLGDAERFPRIAHPEGAPAALIIAPTRELAMQVQRELAWLYAETGARIITCVGGMDPRAEGRQLNSGADIVVGTPGRLRDHIERRRLDLSALKAIVLDEADEMLDLGFREDLEFILDKTPAARQTLLFSATMPRDIEAMATRYQREAVRIETIRRNEQHADIDYRAIKVAPNDLENAVVNILRFHEPRAALVFCTTREAVKRMHARLVERGFAAVALSGELTQHERSQALASVRDGRARVLVATDVAARGLDLPDLALVIHAELPHDKETLLHRSGRTGRAGKKGMCVLVVPFNRRRKAEQLIGGARLQVTWGTAPTADDIRARDQERFLSDVVFTEAATDAEQGLAKTLQSGRTADEIALALVRLHRARLPEPEDLADDTGPPRREGRTFERGPRPERAERSERPAWGDRGERRERFSADRPAGDRATSDRPQGERSFAPRTPRDDGREMVWFRLNIGRERNADPKWLLPLICKAGGISKAEIGSIKIFDRDTRFQIVADHADAFAAAARTNKTKEGHISRVGEPSSAPFNDAPPSADDNTVLAAIDALPPRPPRTGPPRDAARPKFRTPDERGPRTFAGNARPRSERPDRPERPDRAFAPRPPRPDKNDRPARRDGPRPDAPRHAGPRQDGPRQDSPRQNGPDATYLAKRKHRRADPV